jgi:hypothetical protein
MFRIIHFVKETDDLQRINPNREGMDSSMHSSTATLRGS